MSFPITFALNNSNENKIGKNISDIVTTTGNLKYPTDIINPTVSVTNGGNIEQIFTCNYMKIPMFSRNYFITDIRVINAVMVEVSGHVDVLETYAAQILAQAAIVERQENLWNLYLNDGLTFKVTDYIYNSFSVRFYNSRICVSSCWKLIIFRLNGKKG